MVKRLKSFFKKHFTIKITSTVNIPVYHGQLLTDKIALIIGGCGGIGSAIAREYVENGCRVIIMGTKKEKLEDLCLRFGEDKAQYIVFDVLNIISVDQKVADAAKVFGKIDILVYSAGIHGHDSFGTVSEQTWDSVINVNLKGMYFVCQSVSNYMIANKIKGHILTVSSASCTKPGWTPYEISKNAVRSLTLGFADKLTRYGIIVNSIAPGPVATPMLGESNENITWEGNPSGRMCTPEEIANIALIMVSSMGDMIVGDTYFVSGGSGTVCFDK